MRPAPVGCEAQVQVLALEQAVHEREDLDDQLVLPQVVAALVNDLVPPAAHCNTDTVAWHMAVHGHNLHGELVKAQDYCRRPIKEIQ